MDEKRDGDAVPREDGDEQRRGRPITRRDLLKMGWSLPLIVTTMSPFARATDSQVPSQIAAIPHIDLFPHVDHQYHQDGSNHLDTNNHRDVSWHVDGGPPDHVDSTPHLDNTPHVDSMLHQDTQPHTDTQPHADVQPTGTAPSPLASTLTS